MSVALIRTESSVGVAHKECTVMIQRKKSQSVTRAVHIGWTLTSRCALELLKPHEHIYSGPINHETETSTFPANLGLFSDHHGLQGWRNEMTITVFRQHRE